MAPARLTDRALPDSSGWRGHAGPWQCRRRWSEPQVPAQGIREQTIQCLTALAYARGLRRRGEPGLAVWCAGSVPRVLTTWIRAKRIARDSGFRRRTCHIRSSEPCAASSSYSYPAGSTPVSRSGPRRSKNAGLGIRPPSWFTRVRME